MSGKSNVGIQLGSGSWTHFFKKSKIIITIIPEDWHESTHFINILDAFQKLKWFISLNITFKVAFNNGKWFYCKEFQSTSNIFALMWILIVCSWNKFRIKSLVFYSQPYKSTDAESLNIEGYFHNMIYCKGHSASVGFLVRGGARNKSPLDTKRWLAFFSCDLSVLKCVNLFCWYQTYQKRSSFC